MKKYRLKPVEKLRLKAAGRLSVGILQPVLTGNLLNEVIL